MNSLFLSAAAQNNHEALLPVFGSVAKAGVQVDVPLPSGETLNEIQFLHLLSDRAVWFKQDRESDGTIAFLALLGPIVAAPKTGGVVCIDELDASLRLLLAAQLIRPLSGSSRNAKAAQLICNTYDTN